ncbi:MAG: HNH endonuclease [Solirubrobacterales bacterium]
MPNRRDDSRIDRVVVRSIPSPSHPLLHWDPAAADPSQRRIHPLLRGAVLHRDGWTCRYCGGEAMGVDHVAPRARGGPTTPANLVAACQRCNRTKGLRTPAEWQRDQALEGLLAKPSPCRSRRNRTESAVRTSRCSRLRRA